MIEIVIVTLLVLVVVGNCSFYANGPWDQSNGGDSKRGRGSRYKVSNDLILSYRLPLSNVFLSGDLTVLTSDSTLIMGGQNGVIVAYNGPRKEWQIVPDGQPISGLALGADGLLYIASMHSIYALNLTSRHFLWNFTSSWGFLVSPALGPSSTVFVTNDDGELFALQKGKVLWSVRIWPKDNVNSLEGSPTTGSDGTVFVASRNGTLFAFDCLSGQMKWHTKTLSTESIFAGPILTPDEDFIYIYSDYRLYKISSKDGSIDWNSKQLRRVVMPPVISPLNGMIFISSGDYKRSWDTQPISYLFMPNGTRVDFSASCSSKYQVLDWNYAPTIDTKGQLIFKRDQTVLCPPSRIESALVVTSPPNATALPSIQWNYTFLPEDQEGLVDLGNPIIRPDGSMLVIAQKWKGTSFICSYMYSFDVAEGSSI